MHIVKKISITLIICLVFFTIESTSVISNETEQVLAGYTPITISNSSPPGTIEYPYIGDTHNPSKSPSPLPSVTPSPTPKVTYTPTSRPTHIPTIIATPVQEPSDADTASGTGSFIGVIMGNACPIAIALVILITAVTVMAYYMKMKRESNVPDAPTKYEMYRMVIGTPRNMYNEYFEKLRQRVLRKKLKK